MHVAAFPALGLKRPGAQSAQMRSDVGDFGVASRCPAWQFVNGEQIASLVAVAARERNCVCVSHCVIGLQTRSRLYAGAACCHCKAVHIVRSRQTRLRRVVGDTNSHCKGEHVAQASHLRSDESPGSCDSYWPLEQTVRALQTRFCVAEGALDSYCCAVQILICLQLVWLGSSWYCVTPSHGPHVLRPCVAAKRPRAQLAHEKPEPAGFQ